MEGQKGEDETMNKRPVCYRGIGHNIGGRLVAGKIPTDDVEALANASFRSLCRKFTDPTMHAAFEIFRNDIVLRAADRKSIRKSVRRLR